MFWHVLECPFSRLSNIPLYGYHVLLSIHLLVNTLVGFTCGCCEWCSRCLLWVAPPWGHTVGPGAHSKCSVKKCHPHCGHLLESSHLLAHPILSSPRAPHHFLVLVLQSPPTCFRLCRPSHSHGTDFSPSFISAQTATCACLSAFRTEGTSGPGHL